VTDEPPEAETEAGLPGRQGEFPISLPWLARFLLTAGIGAVVGFAASTILPFRAGFGAAWIMTGAGAIAATLLSIRKVHGWHASTFADGTLAGLAAPPIFVILTFLRAALQPHAQFTLMAGALGDLLVAVLYSFVGTLITVPCGWLAGFAYHLVLAVADRRQPDDADPA
jgi:hypothetical protein